MILNRQSRRPSLLSFFLCVAVNGGETPPRIPRFPSVLRSTGIAANRDGSLLSSSTEDKFTRTLRPMQARNASF